MSVYDSLSFFNRTDFEEARSIVLTSEDGVSTDVRWKYESNWLMGKIANYVDLSTDRLVLDFGCGIGRLSKEFVERECCVIGVDFSTSMLIHAKSYVDSDLFMPISPFAFEKLLDNGLEVDIALTIWVLQHIPDVGSEIDRLYRAIRDGGYLIVADMNHRALPTPDGWVNDGISCFALLSVKFELIDRIVFDPPFAPQNLHSNAYFAVFKKC